MRLAFVTPWYGEEIPGGAEAALRHTARHLHEAGITVEILTTCIRDAGSDWGRNYHRPGTVLSGGIRIRRFPVVRRNAAVFDAVNAKLLRGETITPAEEAQYLAGAVNSPALTAYVAAHRDFYTAYLCMPYLFGTSYACTQACPEKTVLIPCLHEEPYAHLRCFREVYPKAAGMLFHAAPEQALAASLGLIGPEMRTAVTGIGMDTAIAGDPVRFREKFGISSPFLLYAGRKADGKNLPLLLEYFAAYRRMTAENLHLVLLGGGKAEIPAECRAFVHDLGYVPAQDKYDACAAALLLCQPSIHESFSLVVMESWLCGRPVLVHGGCAVTRTFVTQARGGLYFGTFAEFAACIRFLHDHPVIAAQMGQNGRCYVFSHFAWEDVIRRYLAFFGASGREAA